MAHRQYVQHQERREERQSYFLRSGFRSDCTGRGDRGLSPFVVSNVRKGLGIRPVFFPPGGVEPHLAVTASKFLVLDSSTLCRHDGQRHFLWPVLAAF